MEIDHLEIAKLELEEGDILLVRAPLTYNPESIHFAIEHALKRAGVNVPVIISPPDIEMQVMKAPAA